jgi:hypothetical protein
MDALELSLQERWGLRLKEDSKELLLLQGAAGPSVPEDWRIVDQLSTLGHIIAADENPSACLAMTLKGAWRAFCRQHSVLLQGIQPKAKGRLSIVRYLMLSGTGHRDGLGHVLLKVWWFSSSSGCWLHWLASDSSTVRASRTWQ